MKKWLFEFQWILIGGIAGGALGYLYWWWIGCDSGTCAITSDPFHSTLYFSLMGALLFSGFRKKRAE